MKEDLNYNHLFYDEKDGLDRAKRALYEKDIIDEKGVSLDDKVTAYADLSIMFDGNYKNFEIIGHGKYESKKEFLESIIKEATQLLENL